MHGPENPGDIPKIRKLATLKQYEFLNGIPPGFFSCGTLFPAKAKGLRKLQGLPWAPSNGPHLL